MDSLVSSATQISKEAAKDWALAERLGQLDLAEVCCTADSRLTTAFENA